MSGIIEYYPLLDSLPVLPIIWSRTLVVEGTFEIITYIPPLSSIEELVLKSSPLDNCSSTIKIGYPFIESTVVAYEMATLIPTASISHRF